FVTKTPDGEKLISSALQAGILIIPDERSNALVVSAPLDNIPLLKNLIQALDSTTPREATIKVFPLVNADATQMATILRDLFRMPSSGNGATNLDGPAISYQLGSSGTSSTPDPAAGSSPDGGKPADSSDKAASARS